MRKCTKFINLSVIILFRKINVESILNREYKKKKKRKYSFILRNIIGLIEYFILYRINLIIKYKNKKFLRKFKYEKRT